MAIPPEKLAHGAKPTCALPCKAGERMYIVSAKSSCGTEIVRVGPLILCEV